jgi:hypothetical protein
MCVGLKFVARIDKIKFVQNNLGHTQEILLNSFAVRCKILFSHSKQPR